MYIRQKKNQSGTTSIQIVDKSQGKYKVHKTIGSSSDPEELAHLIEQGKSYIKDLIGQHEIDFTLGDDQHFYDTVYHSIQAIQLLGPEMVLGKIFDQIGFYAIEDELFRHLVITRLVYPVSKLKTIDYLMKYRGITIDKDQIYRYLDKLHQYQIDKVKQISYRHTLNLFPSQLSVVFYDVTTLYFEAEEEDDLRKTGFSKEGKHKHPQIVIGLLVSWSGYPLDYEIFEGNKFEGHTMLPVLEAFKQKYGLKDLVIVADAGMMSTKNIEQLSQKGYEFIVGARLKNETHSVQKKIKEFSFEDRASISISKEDGNRIIVSYSEKRAKKDAHNRRKGLTKLEKALQKGKLSKKHINNKGYNKYLKLQGDINITIDYEKYHADSLWDGLKGYITNSKLSKEEIITHYHQLWIIEKTFRISKTDLRIRPVFHYRERRIRAHICIAFAACKVYKELERQLYKMKAELSPEKVIDILKTIYGITIILPQSKQKKIMLLDKTEEQKKILNLFNLN